MGITHLDVSMKSGLEGRNKCSARQRKVDRKIVSMKSGLEGRNKVHRGHVSENAAPCLNEVRPRRPEQYENGCQVVAV